MTNTRLFSLPAFVALVLKAAVTAPAAVAAESTKGLGPGFVVPSWAGDRVGWAAWNGSEWTDQSVPLPAETKWAELDGVSCTSSVSCTAVGIHGETNASENTLAERFG